MLRELKKALPILLKEKSKNYNLKKKDFMLWFSKDGLFFDLHIDVKVKEDGCCCCTTKETMKPLWLDDLLWEFLDMLENKKEPLSLRSIGAFTVHGSHVYKNSEELEHWDLCELERSVDTYLEHFYQSIQVSTIYDFYSNIELPSYHSELRTSLSLLHDRKYQDAITYLKTLGRGEFCNKDIWIYDSIRNYCEANV